MKKFKLEVCENALDELDRISKTAMGSSVYAVDVVLARIDRSSEDKSTYANYICRTQFSEYVEEWAN